MASSLLDPVVDHALGTRLSDIPADSVGAALRLILDAVGVGVAGSTTPESAMALGAARAWGSGAEAGVWGTGSRLPAGSAAFVNGHQMHCLEFDAIHERAVVHPLTVVLPVLGAYCQRLAASRRQVCGADLVAAVAVGVDIAAGLGEVTTTPLRFFRPATAGALGAVAGLITLARPAREVATAAMGVVYGALSGTMQPHLEGGAQVLALQVGLNARAALHSFDLAMAGFRGPRDILDGPYGYFRLIEAGGEPQRMIARLGRRWEVGRTAVKPFPSGRATHGALDAILELRERHALRVEDVAGVEVTVPPMVRGLVGRPATAGMTAGAARLCLSFLVAVALRRGTVDLSVFAPSVMGDIQLLEFASRVRVRADANPDPNAFNPQTVVVTMRDGTVHSLTKQDVLGSPEAPLSRERLEEKFVSNLRVAGRENVADGLLATVRDLPRADDAAVLFDRL